MKPSPLPSALAETIINRIQEQQICHRPKWCFQIRNIFFWSLFWISLFIGSLGTTMLIYAVNELGVAALPPSLLHYTFSTLPFYWAVLFLLFTGLALLGFQKTKHGYKISFLSLILCNLGASLFLGSNIYFFGGGDILDYTVDNLVQTYQSMDQRRIILWDRPRQGILAGTIIAHQDGRCWIKSLRNQIWELDLKNIEKFTPVTGLAVRVNGSITNSNTFFVEDIQYWQFNPWQRKPFIIKQNERPSLFMGSYPLKNNPEFLQKVLEQ